MNLINLAVHIDPIDKLFFEISPLGGILMLFIFSSGWFFGDFIFKISNKYLKFSSIGFLILIFDFFYINTISIFIEHIIIFSIGFLVSFIEFIWRIIYKRPN